MRASHKKRIARLVAVLDETEEEAFDERCTRRFEAFVCEDIRMAMEWRGIDPASSRVLRETEARGAHFVDTPEQRAADWAVLEAKRERSLAAGDDPWSDLGEELDGQGQRYLDGSRPNFAFAALMELWAWAVYQPSLLPAVQYDFTAGPDGPRTGASGSS
jgi:hypothetical protein